MFLMHISNLEPYLLYLLSIFPDTWLSADVLVTTPQPQIQTRPSDSSCTRSCKSNILHGKEGQYLHDSNKNTSSYIDMFCKWNLFNSLWCWRTWSWLVWGIWVRSRNCGCLVTWICYQLIAKPGNKTAAVPWPDPYLLQYVFCSQYWYFFFFSVEWLPGAFCNTDLQLWQASSY